MEETMKCCKPLFAVWLLTAGICASAQASTAKPWSAAEYHGLIVGTSTREDVLRALGKSTRLGREQDTGTRTMTYNVIDPVAGTLVIYTKSGVVNEMMLTPRRRLTKADIVRLYGTDYRVVRYAMEDCIGEGGAGPIYETPGGPIKHLEYRDRGLAVVYAYDSDDQIEAIIFTSKPFGPTQSICAARRSRKRAVKP